jgi:hypothetical protein
MDSLNDSILIPIPDMFIVVMTFSTKEIHRFGLISSIDARIIQLRIPSVKFELLMTQ